MVTHVALPCPESGCPGVLDLTVTHEHPREL